MRYNIFRLTALLLTVLFMVVSLIQYACAQDTVYHTETGFPPLSAVRDQLDENEIVGISAIVINQGDSLDPSDTSVFRIEKTDMGTESIEISLFSCHAADGTAFSSETPGNYTAYYIVKPDSGNPIYEISRSITVNTVEMPSPTIFPEMTDSLSDSDTTEEKLEDNPYEESETDGSKATSGDESDHTTPEQDASRALSPVEGSAEAPILHSASPEEEEASETGIDEGIQPYEESSTMEGPPDSELPPPEFDPASSLWENDGALEDSSESAPLTASHDSESTTPSEIIPFDPFADETSDVVVQYAQGREAVIEAPEDSITEESTVENALPEENKEYESQDNGAEIPADDDENVEGNIILEGPAHMERWSKIQYPSALGNWSTFVYTVDGKLAYCLESAKASPKDGYFAQELPV